MDNYLAQLGDIDRKINILLLDKEINSEEITELVDTRDQILQVLVDYASKNERFAKSEQWQQAIVSTQQLVNLMATETAKIADQLRKFRQGQKSIRQYQKFL
jgi:flagellar rod protein FlaI